MIKRLSPIILLLFFSQICFGQNYLEEVNGRPIKGKVSEDISGSPYLFKNFKLGTVLFKDGKTLKDIPVNVDLVNQLPVFSNKNNQTLSFVDPVSSFSVSDTLINGLQSKRYILLNSNGEEDCYLVLANGKLTLLKKIWKVVWEDKTYNSATVTKTILEKSAYYTADNDFKGLNLIKPSKKSILALMSDQSTAVDTYLKDNKVNFNTDEDLIKLFLQYNSF